MRKFEKIGLILKHNQPKAVEIGIELTKWLLDREKEVLIPEEIGKTLNKDFYIKKRITSESDIVIVLGGDGTFLSVARLVKDYSIPIIGVNLGGLGFLTEVKLDEMYDILNDIFNGNYTINERMMLKASLYRGGEKISSYSVLNDVVINKGTLARIIELKTSVNDTFVTKYRADGLIVSTPTGSTAYSLAAGGPIIYPELNCIILTPICPHTLTNRPLVISGNDLITVELNSLDNDVMITLDGQVGFSLRDEDVVKIEKDEKKTLIISSPKKNYFETLRNKLKWGL